MPPRFRGKNPKRLTNRTVNKWVYDFLAVTLARLRTPGVFQQLHRVQDGDMPQVLDAILKMERRFAKKAQGADTPLTELGQGLRAEIHAELWAALLVRPRNHQRGGTPDDGPDDDRRNAAAAA